VKLHHGHYLPDQFPRFSRVPSAVEAGTNGALPDGDRQVYILNAPGRLEFELHGNERRLQLEIGILPGAYQRGGNTDGVEFKVTLLPPDGPAQTLSSHLLQPVTNPADRGDRAFTIEIPPVAAGARLQVSTLPGLQGDLAWDWAYIASLRFE
jgi:hypothetical protein